MELISTQLKMLKLSGMSEHLPVRLHEAQANELPYQEFLSRLIVDEMTRRKDSQLKKRLKNAGFPSMKSLNTFDYNFNPSIKKQKILELAACSFIPKGQNVLFIGPPGVGKTHLTIALGLSAVEKGYLVLYRSIFDLAEDFLDAQLKNMRRELIQRLVKVDLLIIDEFGMKKMPPCMAEDLLEIFHKRYQKKSTIISTNRPVEDWAKLLEDSAATTAILDRFLEGIHFLKITGKSYRLNNALEQ